MSGFRSYLELCRTSNLPTVWSNVLCALVLSLGRYQGTPFLLLAAALSCFYLAGMCLNDICDADHDRLRRPERPIPSGQVSLRDAWLMTLALAAGGLLLTAYAPRPEGVTGATLLLVVIVLYDLWHKRNPASVLLMAGCRLLLFVVVALALVGRLPQRVAAAALLQAGYVVMVSLVARYENSRQQPFVFPVIPAMLAGICLVDGAVLALLQDHRWLWAGVAGSVLTWGGQGLVRGD